MLVIASGSSFTKIQRKEITSKTKIISTVLPSCEDDSCLPFQIGTKFPDEFRWIFEFEYVDKEIEDPKLKYQYNVTPNAHVYKKDRDDLNK